MKEHLTQFSFQMMSHAYNVSRSGYYDWLNRQPSQRELDNQSLIKCLQEAHQKSHGIYGSPRITKQLEREGILVSENIIARLMRREGIVGSIYTAPSIVGVMKQSKNKRLRLPAPTKKNQVWTGDVAYLWHQKRWWYLAVVMDLYSRKIIGWKIESYRRHDLTIDALKHALEKRKPKTEMLFHSDRGAEYAAKGYRDLLERHAIHPNMNRPGHCTDDAHMESFFHSLKGEWLRGNKYDTVDALRKSVRDYIVHFYNRTRLHSSLNYCSPNEFERLQTH